MDQEVSPEPNDNVPRASPSSLTRLVVPLLCAVVFFVYDRTYLSNYRDVAANLDITRPQYVTQGSPAAVETPEPSEDIPHDDLSDAPYFNLDEDSVHAAIQWTDYDDAIVYCDIETGHSYHTIADVHNTPLSNIDSEIFEAAWDQFHDSEVLDELTSHPAWLAHGQDWIRRQYRWLQSMRDRHVKGIQSSADSDTSLLEPHPNFAEPSKNKLYVFDETEHFDTPRDIHGDAKKPEDTSKIESVDDASVWGWPLGFLYPLPSVSISGLHIRDILGLKQTHTSTVYDDGTTKMDPTLKKAFLRLLIAQAVGLGPDNKPLFGPIQTFLQSDEHMAPSRLLKEEPLYYNKAKEPFEPYISPRFAFRLSERSRSILHSNEIMYITEGAERSCAELHTNYVHTVIESVANAISSLKELLSVKDVEAEADGTADNGDIHVVCHSDVDAAQAYRTRAPWTDNHTLQRFLSDDPEWHIPSNTHTVDDAGNRHGDDNENDNENDGDYTLSVDPFVYMEEFLAKHANGGVRHQDHHHQGQSHKASSSTASETQPQAPQSRSLHTATDTNDPTTTTTTATATSTISSLSPFRMLQYHHGPQHPVVLAKYVYIDVAASDTVALGHCSQPFGVETNTHDDVHTDSDTPATKDRTKRWGRKQMEGPACADNRHPQYQDMPIPYLGMSEAYTLIMDPPSTTTTTTTTTTTNTHDNFLKGKLGAPVHIEITAHTLWGALHAMKRAQQLLQPWGILRKSIPAHDPTRYQVSSTPITHFTPYTYDAFVALTARLWDNHHKDTDENTRSVLESLRSLEGHPIVKLATVAGFTASTEIRDQCLFASDVTLARRLSRTGDGHNNNNNNNNNNNAENNVSDASASETRNALLAERLLASALAHDLAPCPDSPVHRLRSSPKCTARGTQSTTDDPLLTPTTLHSSLAALFSTLTFPDRHFSGLASVLPIRLPLLVLDRPMKPWRGISYDTARHYSPIPTLQTIVDLLSHSLDNTLHWHITDAQSFPIILPSLPHLAEAGKWGEGLVYTPEDTIDIVTYAAKRGIRVVPEIDMPAHTAVWGKAVPELIIDCSISRNNLKEMDKFALDPSIDATYDMIDKMFHDLSMFFPDSHIHIGADEVVPECWARDSRLKRFAKEDLVHLYETVGGWYEDDKIYVTLLSYFISRVSRIADSYGKSQMSWEDSFDRIRTHQQLDKVPDTLWNRDEPWPPQNTPDTPEAVYYPPHMGIQAWKCWEAHGNAVLRQGLRDSVEADLQRTVEQVDAMLDHPKSNDSGTGTGSATNLPNKHFFPPVSRLYDPNVELDPSEWPVNWWQFLAMTRAGGRGLINASCWYLDWNLTWADVYTLWPYYMEAGDWRELGLIAGQHYDLFEKIFEVERDNLHSHEETENGDEDVTKDPNSDSESDPESDSESVPDAETAQPRSLAPSTASLTEALFAPHPFWGGEAAIWMEHVDASNVFCRVFPRKMAVADMLWSESAIFDRLVRQSRDQAGDTIYLPIKRTPYYAKQTFFAAPRLLHLTRNTLRMGVPISTLSVFDSNAPIGSFVSHIREPAWPPENDYHWGNGWCTEIGQDIQRDKQQLDDLVSKQLRHARRLLSPVSGVSTSFVGDLFERMAESYTQQTGNDGVKPDTTPGTTPGTVPETTSKAPSFILWNVQDGGFPDDRIHRIVRYLRDAMVDVVAIVEANDWDTDREFDALIKRANRAPRRLGPDTQYGNKNNAVDRDSEDGYWVSSDGNTIPHPGRIPQSLSQSNPRLDAWMSVLSKETDVTARNLDDITTTNDNNNDNNNNVGGQPNGHVSPPHVTITTEEISDSGRITIRKLASGSPSQVTFGVKYLGGIFGYPYTHIHLSDSGYHVTIHSALPMSVVVEDGPAFSRAMIAVDILGVRYIVTHLHAQSALHRARETTYLADLIQRYTDRNIPVVLLGDLNTLSPVDAPCHARYGLVDAVTGIGAPPHLKGKYLCRPNTTQWEADGNTTTTTTTTGNDVTLDLMLTPYDDDSCAHQFNYALQQAQNLFSASDEETETLRSTLLKTKTSLIPDYRPFFSLTHLSLPDTSTSVTGGTPPLVDLLLRTMEARHEVGAVSPGYEGYQCPASYPAQSIYKPIAEAVGDTSYDAPPNDNAHVPMRLDYALANDAFLERYPDIECEIVGWMTDDGTLTPEDLDIPEVNEKVNLLKKLAAASDHLPLRCG